MLWMLQSQQRPADAHVRRAGLITAFSACAAIAATSDARKPRTTKTLAQIQTSRGKKAATTNNRPTQKAPAD